MNDLVDFGFGTQIRKSPFFEATVRWGAKSFSVYNHMYIPRDFGDPERNFWNLLMKPSFVMLLWRGKFRSLVLMHQNLFK
tara:strand:- start:691 stop:930 length:240 start_codon:yes stop_codon:yes gene_type:complete